MELRCREVGWSREGLYCGSNVTFNGVALDQSSTPTTYTGSPCPYSAATCDEVLPPPRAPIPSHADHTVSQTSTAPLSRTARQSARTQSATTQSVTSQKTGSLLTANNSCTMTPRSLLSPSATPSAALLAAPSPIRCGPVHIAAQLIGSEAAARAVVSGASVSAAMSSVVSAPSAIASASRVASLSKVVDCGFGADIDGEDAIPDMLDLPVHPAVGSSRLRYYVGVARFYFSEELLASCATAAIANAPRVLGSCHGLVWAMGAVAVAHVAFVAVLRPYDSQIDNVWSLLIASLQVALSIVQTAVVYGANGRDYAAALVLALSASFFLQAAFGAIAECVALSRRRVQRSIQGLGNNSNESDSDSMLAVPLANTVNPLADAVPPSHYRTATSRYVKGTM